MKVEEGSSFSDHKIIVKVNTWHAQLANTQRLFVSLSGHTVSSTYQICQICGVFCWWILELWVNLWSWKSALTDLISCSNFSKQIANTKRACVNFEVLFLILKLRARKKDSVFLKSCTSVWKCSENNLRYNVLFPLKSWISVSNFKCWTTETSNRSVLHKQSSFVFFLIFSGMTEVQFSN